MFHKEDLVNIKDKLKESWQFGKDKYKLEKIAYFVVASYALVGSFIVYNTGMPTMEVKAEESVLPTGWQQVDGQVVYIAEDGTYVTGLQNIEQSIYYFNEKGFLQLGWHEIMGKSFYFDETGKLVTGETVINGSQYNIQEDGTLFTGWQETADGRYYYNEFGYHTVGYAVIDGDRYCFDETGLLRTGWINIDNNIYFADEEGKIATGERKIADKTYHFSAEGILSAGWFLQGEDMYYKQEGGTLAVGAQTIDGVEYQFTEEGKLIRNQTVGMYTYDSNGIRTRDAISTANLDAALDEILQQTGNDIASIGEYVRTHLRYKYKDRMNTREEMAVYALNNKSVSCYYYAALTGLLLERAGYETLTVLGKGFVYTEHNWNLVKTSRNGIEGWYHVDSLKGQYVKTDAELVAKGFQWQHENYPATP